MNMKNFKYGDLKSWVRKETAVFLLLLFALYYAIAHSYGMIRALQVKNQWLTFNSREQLLEENNPDGFQMSYPADWEIIRYDGGGSHNLSEARVGFDYPYYLFNSYTIVRVWWRPLDDEWAVSDSQEWPIEDLGFDYIQGSLDIARTSFEQTTIGVNNYPALRTMLRTGIRKKETIVLTIFDDEAYVITFTNTRSNQIDGIFEQMLDSFELLE